MSKDRPHTERVDLGPGDFGNLARHRKPFNPCPAELLQLYFSSFEAGIADAISSFK